MTNIYALFMIPVGYLLGSFSPSCVIARLVSKVDLRKEGDGRVSATAVYRYTGWPYFILALLLDVGKAVAAILICRLVTDNQWIIWGVGLAVVAGHCWSVFIRFKGGLGATVIYGVLVSLVTWQFIIGALAGLILFLFIRKSTLATAIAVLVTSVAILIINRDILLSLYPLLLLLLQFIKRIALKESKDNNYRGDLLHDLKREKG